EDLHDVGMAELCRGARLALEAFPVDRIAGAIGLEDLQRDVPSELFVDRLTDDAHAAAADRAQDPVAAELAGRFTLLREEQIGGVLETGGGLENLEQFAAALSRLLAEVAGRRCGAAAPRFEVLLREHFDPVARARVRRTLLAPSFVRIASRLHGDPSG